jgi:uncharacterized protein
LNSVEEKGVVEERVLKVPEAKDPVLVCGLPGSGYVGKLAADHLVDVFGLKKVAEFSSETFPPQATVKADGTVDLPRGEVFYAPAGSGKSLFVFTADAQPTTSEGEYALSEALVSYAKRCGVKKVYAMAAYITGSFPASPRVFGTGTSKEMLESISKVGATLMKDGGISGMNGLIVGMAALRGLEGACLLGETSGYVVDPAAAKAVLDVLSAETGIPVDTSKLKEKAEETKKLISQLRTLAEQSQETVPQPRQESRPGYIG